MPVPQQKLSLVSIFHAGAGPISPITVEVVAPAVQTAYRRRKGTEGKNHGGVPPCGGMTKVAAARHHRHCRAPMCRRFELAPAQAAGAPPSRAFRSPAPRLPAVWHAPLLDLALALATGASPSRGFQLRGVARPSASRPLRPSPTHPRRAHVVVLDAASHDRDGSSARPGRR